jgi:hypothetical protein
MRLDDDLTLFTVGWLVSRNIHAAGKLNLSQEPIPVVERDGRRSVAVDVG